MEKKTSTRHIRVYHDRNLRGSSIILQGKWLSDLGYEPGDYLSIEPTKDQIVIKITEKYKR